MALSSNTVFEIRPSGSDTNGGGFVTGATGTDYSQQNSKNTSGSDISTTDAVAAGSTTLTSATANFSTAIIGNIIYLQGGSGSLSAGWYQVTARASATSITIDRTVASGTGITMNIGGAFGSIGILTSSSLWGNGMIAYVLNTGTPFSITSATAGVSGGVMNTTATGAIVGYTTNRTLTNTDAKPTINFGVSVIVNLFVTRGLVYNIAFNGNSQTVVRVAGTSDNTTYISCSFTGMNAAAASGIFINCSATANAAAVFVTSIGCEAFANTATPFAGGSFYESCLSYNNTGSTTDGFSLTNYGVAKNCTAYGNGEHGFNTTGAIHATMLNCHAENNAGWGFQMGTSFSFYEVSNCSAYNNTSGTISSTSKLFIVNLATVTAGSVFVNAASGNFALNNTTGQGALLRAAGAPALYPTGLTAAYIDIGAAQHPDPTATVATVAYTSS